MTHAESTAFREVISATMDETMCKKCSQYETGCAPDQVIECAKYFLRKLEEMK